MHQCLRTLGVKEQNNIDFIGQTLVQWYASTPYICLKDSMLHVYIHVNKRDSCGIIEPVYPDSGKTWGVTISYKQQRLGVISMSSNPHTFFTDEEWGRFTKKTTQFAPLIETDAGEQLVGYHAAAGNHNIRSDLTVYAGWCRICKALAPYTHNKCRTCAADEMAMQLIMEEEQSKLKIPKPKKKRRVKSQWGPKKSGDFEINASREELEALGFVF